MHGLVYSMRVPYSRSPQEHPIEVSAPMDIIHMTVKIRLISHEMFLETALP